MNNGLDTDKQIFFYEQEFYVLSNFSSFKLYWKDIDFDTSEQAYHWEKFLTYKTISIIELGEIRSKILAARSAHEAFKIAQYYKEFRRPDWEEVKFSIMKSILWAKVNQHEYVKKKLLETGDRELVENSWRDDVWGWGPDKNGQNMLGKLWMEVRNELIQSK